MPCPLHPLEKIRSNHFPQHQTLAKGAFTNYVDKMKYTGVVLEMSTVCRFSLITAMEFLHDLMLARGSKKAKILSTQLKNTPYLLKNILLRNHSCFSLKDKHRPSKFMLHRHPYSNLPVSPIWHPSAIFCQIFNGWDAFTGERSYAGGQWAGKDFQAWPWHSTAAFSQNGHHSMGLQSLLVQTGQFEPTSNGGRNPV